MQKNEGKGKTNSAPEAVELLAKAQMFDELSAQAKGEDRKTWKTIATKARALAAQALKKRPDI